MATPPTVSEQALRKLEDQLTCGICLDSYTEPKLLQQCFHVFCSVWSDYLWYMIARGYSYASPPQLPSSTPLPPGILMLTGLAEDGHWQQIFEDFFKVLPHESATRSLPRAAHLIKGTNHFVDFSCCHRKM